MPIQKKTSRSLPINHRSPRLIGGLVASLMLTPYAFAADNPGAHEHGQARLQMALENSKIDLMFSSPAYNLAGFEHEARTDQQKKRLADIRQWLETTPLINTEAGSCRVDAATVQLGKESGSQHHQEHHDEKHHHDEEHHHGEKHSDHHDKEETHRDYEVAQQLTCEGMAAGDTFTSPLPARFAELEELAVEWVGPSGQGSALITQSGQSFTLNP